MAVPISRDGEALAPGTPHALFNVDTAEPVGPYPNDYAVSADGQRFVVALNGRVQAPQTLTVFYNWTTALPK
jgi:DNA-binding beta-propeller fold protein YncE